MQNKGTILVVDDEPDIREILQLLLSDEGYRVREAANGAEALAQLDQDIDLIVLDVMMPGDNGYVVCKAIRQTSNVPILFLTARSQDADKVVGLRHGGDDYLTKPFSPSELSARVDALLRRYRVYQGAGTRQAAHFVRRHIRIDFAAGTVYRKEVSVVLTDIEHRILCLLATRAGETIDTRTLYESVWNEPYLDSSASTVMVHIRNLRKKLEDDPANPVIIRTVWGRGYRIDA